MLFEYGTGPVKGFAVTLSIGVVTSVFSALVITRLMFDLYPGDRHVADALDLSRGDRMPFELIPPGTNFDFIGKRYLCFAVSLTLLARRPGRDPRARHPLGHRLRRRHGDADALRRGAGGR